MQDFPTRAQSSTNSPPRLTDAGTTSRFDFFAAQRKRAELFNATPGTLKGYHCPTCHDRGGYMTVEENGALRFQRCKCQSIRDAMGAMDRSGIPPDALAACTWENWKTPENWQRRALAMAQDYVQQIATGDPSWFIICGTPGCGKTTLCTTIFRAIVEGGKPGLYVSWREFARRAKAFGNDRDDFREETEPLKNTPLLYLDDFWKGEIRPADVHLAFELINARYISKKPTILSSENTLEAILRGDEAIGSRLFEMAGGYYMDCSRARNWRTARRQT